MEKDTCCRSLAGVCLPWGFSSVRSVPLLGNCLPTKLLVKEEEDATNRDIFQAAMQGLGKISRHFRLKFHCTLDAARRDT